MLGAAADRSYFAFAVCSAFFLFGCVFGSFLSVYIAEGDSLYSFFSRFFTAFTSSGDISFAGAAADILRFILIDFFFSVSALGIILVPAVSALKGFLSAFSIALVIRLFGFRALSAVLVLFGIDAILFTPVFLEASCAALRNSASVFVFCFGRARGDAFYPKAVLIRFLIFVLAGILIAGIEVMASSLLNTGINSILSGLN